MLRFTALILSLGLAGCGGGDSGGGPTVPANPGVPTPSRPVATGDPGDDPAVVTYSGATNQASLTVAPESAPRMADHALLLMLLTKALTEKVGPLFSAINSSTSCYEQGAGSRGGDGTGWVQTRLTNCDAGFGLRLTGKIVYRVSATVNGAVTISSWSMPGMVVQFDGATYTASGRLEQKPGATVGSDFSPALAVREDASTKVFASDGFTINTTGTGAWAARAFGRIRDADLGFVEASLDAPMSLRLNDPGFQPGGALKLAASNATLWFIPATLRRAAVALEQSTPSASVSSVLLNAYAGLERQVRTPGTAQFGAAAGPTQILEQDKPFKLFGLFTGAESRRWYTISWKSVMKPPGSRTVLQNAGTPLPDFVPDRPGTYTFDLVASDGTTVTHDHVSHQVLFPEDSTAEYPTPTTSSVGPYLGPDIVATGNTAGATLAYSSSVRQDVSFYSYGMNSPDRRSVISVEVAPDAEPPTASVGNSGFYSQFLGNNVDQRRGSQRYIASNQPLQYFRPTGFRVNSPGLDIEVADLFGTGRKDIVMSGYVLITGGNTRGIFIFRNLGAGVYAAPEFVPGGNGGSLIVGDFTGDGRQDIILDAGRSNIDLLAQRADGSWQPAVRIRASGSNCSETNDTVAHPLVKADFDQDGRPDFAMPADCAQTAVSVFFQNGDGTFTDVLLAGANNLTAGADVTGDGIPDVITASSQPATQSAAHVDVYAGRRDRTFAPPASYPVAAEAFSGAFRAGAVGDYDGDGDVDVVMGSPNGYFLFRQNAGILSQGFQIAPFSMPNWADVLAIPVDFWPREMFLSDINGDGLQDVVVRASRSAMYPFSVLIQSPGGGLRQARALFASDDFGGAGSLPVVTDENLDGFDDLVFVGGHMPERESSGVAIVHQRPH
jgi:FG-GAP-like repeat